MPTPKKPQKPNDTSWERVAGWYDSLLAGEGTYQKDLILPNLLRLTKPGAGEVILDLACGQGFFAREFAKSGARVIGVDASQALIDIARNELRERKATPKNANATIAKIPDVDGEANGSLQFFVAKADKMPFVKNATIDKLVIVLALQNIENVSAVLAECTRVLKTGGQFFFILNHPAFRIPKASSWGWDEEAKTQYRRIDKYLSEAKTEIDMHPGKANSTQTLSFHRPLQFYFKAMNKAGLTVATLEEWNSNRKSESGPRAKAEDDARKEIPLFLALVGAKK